MDSCKVELTKAMIAIVDVIEARMEQLHREAMAALKLKLENDMQAFKSEMRAEVGAFTDAVKAAKGRLETI